VYACICRLLSLCAFVSKECLKRRIDIMIGPHSFYLTRCSQISALHKFAACISLHAHVSGHVVLCAYRLNKRVPWTFLNPDDNSFQGAKNSVLSLALLWTPWFSRGVFHSQPMLFRQHDEINVCCLLKGELKTNGNIISTFLFCRGYALPAPRFMCRGTMVIGKSVHARSYTRG